MGLESFGIFSAAVFFVAFVGVIVEIFSPNPGEGSLVAAMFYGVLAFAVLAVGKLLFFLGFAIFTVIAVLLFRRA